MAPSIWTCERGTLWGVDLNEPIPTVSPRLDATLGPVTAESASALTSAMGLASLVQVERRFSEGRRCFAAWWNGKIVAYGWVSQCSEYIGEQEREIKLDADEAYIWDCATLPEFRGQRLYSALLGHMLRVLQGEGIRQVWIGTAVTNRASLAGFAHAGFRPVISITYIRLLNLRLVWVGQEPGAPRPWFVRARQALIGPEERTYGPLVVNWSSSGATRPRAAMKV